MPYEIINRNPNSDVKGIQVGKRKGTFLNNIMRTNDAGLARDIRQRFGQDRKDGRDADVLVAEVPDRDPNRIVSSGFGEGKWDEIRKMKSKPNEVVREKYD